MKLKEEAEKQYRDNASRQAAKVSNAEGDGDRLNNGEDSTWGKISFLNGIEIAQLSNDHLKRHLAARSEPIDGSKKKLIERLTNSIEDERHREVRIAKEKEHCRIRDLEQVGSVYVAGKNDQGQLGLGDFDDRHEFTVVPALRGKQVCQLSAYGSVSIATTLTSEVYAWGGNGVNPILLGDTSVKSESFASPQQMTKLDGEETVATSAGSTHACSISKAGDLFIWGKLGNEDTRLIPEYIDQFTAASTACGARHIAVVTDKGELYTWGGIGSIDQSFQATPMLITLPALIKFVSCGSQHIIAATETHVFSWGCGDGFRLGHGDDCSEKISPCEVVAAITELGGSILDVGAGTWHSACIISNEASTKGSGLLYTWGSGYYGQLALDEQCIAKTPTKVEELSGMKKIICGRTHNCAISHDNILHTWGSNEHGQLGRLIEETDVTFTPHPGIAEFGTIVNRIGRGAPCAVACGDNFTVVATHAYEGPSEQEMIKLLETKRRKELEEKEEEARLLRVQQEEETRRRKADAEKKKIRYLTSKRLCTMDSTCPGFTYESSTPSVCRECGYSVAFHTIVADADEKDSEGEVKE